jgi:hypothetical protein
VKKIVWDTPNKMHFDSPFVVFNQQTNVIGTGNMIANTQFSWHVRSYTETTCNGLTWEPGFLRETDLKRPRELGVSAYILKKVREHTQEQAAWIYIFSHYSVSAKRRIIDGVVLTSYHHRLLHTWYVNRDWRAEAAVTEAIKYITDDEQTGEEQGA